MSLVEPSADLTVLRVSAATTETLVGTEIPMSAVSATVGVYRTGQALFLADPIGHPLVSPALLQLTAARSVYLVPVRSAGSVTAVLLVAWKHRVPDLDDRRVSVVTLLADQAGVALRQAMLVSELESLALTDTLTGLPNRRNWDQRLASLLATAGRTGLPLTVALADLDRFKQFNDSFGHPAGDVLLHEFATGAQAAVRIDDFVARWGGEEFAVALPNCPTAEAAKVLDRMRRAIGRGQSCSIGYATWDGTESAEDLVQRADAALYEAKRTGRDRVSAA